MTTRRELLAAFAGTNARFLRHRRGADNRAENHRRDTRGEKARYVSGLNPWAPLWGLSVREVSQRSCDAGVARFLFA